MSHLQNIVSKAPGMKRKDTEDVEDRGAEKKMRSDASVSDEIHPTSTGNSVIVDDEREEDLDQEAFANLEAAALMEGINVEDILALVDQAASVQEMDDVQLKQALSRLQRALDKNAELRIKYPDDPTKFMMSEVDVDECITALINVATEPALFPKLASTGVELLLQVLLHDNVDLGVAVMELLAQIIDEEELSCIVDEDIDLAGADTTPLLSYKQGAWALVNTIHENGGFRIMVNYLMRLNERDARHQSATASGFSIFSALVDTAPAFARVLIQQTPLYAFALFRSKYATSYVAAASGVAAQAVQALIVAADGNASNAATLTTSQADGGSMVPANRLSAAELVLALTQSCPQEAAAAVCGHGEAMEKLWDAVLGQSGKRDKKPGIKVKGGVCTSEDGVVELLCSFAPYRKVKKISDATEDEFFASIATTLCLLMSTSLADTPCRELLGKAQGLELMLSCMGQGGVAAGHALRVLESWAEDNAKDKALVDRGLLKVLFPLWALHERKSTGDHLLACERAVSLVHHMLFTLQDTYLLRLVHKFREDNFAKCGYLVSLLKTALSRLSKAEGQHRAAHGLRAIADPMVGYGSVDTYRGRGGVAAVVGVDGVKLEADEDDVWGGEGAEERYLRRLGSGLFMCQRVCVVVAMLVCLDSSKGSGESIEEAVLGLFERNNIDIDVVVNVCTEYCRYLREGEYKEVVQMTLSDLRRKLE